MAGLIPLFRNRLSSVVTSVVSVTHTALSEKGTRNTWLVRVALSILIGGRQKDMVASMIDTARVTMPASGALPLPLLALLIVVLTWLLGCDVVVIE